LSLANLGTFVLWVVTVLCNELLTYPSRFVWSGFSSPWCGGNFSTSVVARAGLNSSLQATRYFLMPPSILETGNKCQRWITSFVADVGLPSLYCLIFKHGLECWNRRVLNARQKKSTTNQRCVVWHLTVIPLTLTLLFILAIHVPAGTHGLSGDIKS
jgi:hypothetical protein